MLASAVIPIPRSVIERCQLDLKADENQISTNHFFAFNSRNEIGVLTSLQAIQPQYVWTLYFSEFDLGGNLKYQVDLPETTKTTLQQDRLSPAAIAYLSNEHLLIGSATSYMDKFMCGLYVVDVAHDHIVNRFPWFAAKIAWTHDNYLLGTLHATLDRQFREGLDDAIVISTLEVQERFELGKSGGELPSMRLVAVFNPSSPKDFPDAYGGLDLSRPRKRLLRSRGLCGNWQTHSIVPINDGNFIASIWEMARHQVVAYYFAIFSREGDPLHVIEAGIEKFSQFANDPVHGVLVYRGDSEMAVYDYEGWRSATIPLDKSTASTLKNYELISINQPGQLLFASRPLKQTNSFFLLDGSDNREYTNYGDVVKEGVKKHKTWLQKRKKYLAPDYFRWTS